MPDAEGMKYPLSPGKITFPLYVHSIFAAPMALNSLSGSLVPTGKEPSSFLSVYLR